MLANALAVLVGIGSLAFYLAAFFLPEVHRKSDFLLSGIGLFYAVVLWFCAGQITGAVLLGQLAGVTLVLWLGWQTLSMRRSTTPSAQQTPVKAVFKSSGTAQLHRQRLESLTAAHGSALEYEFVEDASLPSQTIAVVRPRHSQPAEAPSAVVSPSSSPQPEPPLSVTADSIPPSPSLPAPGVDRVPTGAPGSGNRTPPAAAAPAVENPRKSAAASPNLTQKVQILMSWLKELSASRRRPKPTQPMIELPPRPPSIPRSGPEKPVTVQLPEVEPSVSASVSGAEAPPVAASLPSEPIPEPSTPVSDSGHRPTAPPTLSAADGNPEEIANWPEDEADWPNN
jgi:hypothetical protein